MCARFLAVPPGMTFGSTTTCGTLVRNATKPTIHASGPPRLTTTSGRIERILVSARNPAIRPLHVPARLQVLRTFHGASACVLGLVCAERTLSGSALDEDEEI